MTMLDVARHVDVSWDVVKDIQKRNLKCRFKRPRLRGLSEIAIDEIYLGKRGRFITVVLPELRRELQRVAANSGEIGHQSRSKPATVSEQIGHPPVTRGGQHRA